MKAIFFRTLYQIIFSNGAAYRGPRWYAVADWMKAQWMQPTS